MELVTGGFLVTVVFVGLPKTGVGLPRVTRKFFNSGNRNYPGQPGATEGLLLPVTKLPIFILIKE